MHLQFSMLAGQANGNNLALGDYFLLAFLIFVILISIIGNFLVCLAIFTVRKLRKLGNAFIVSLAVADLLVSCLVMPFALYNDFARYWPFGGWFCDIWISTDIMCSTASILNLCAISLDRFIHIKDCLLYNKHMTKKLAVASVVLIWLISAVLSFVPMFLDWRGPKKATQLILNSNLSEKSFQEKTENDEKTIKKRSTEFVANNNSSIKASQELISDNHLSKNVDSRIGRYSRAKVGPVTHQNGDIYLRQHIQQNKRLIRPHDQNQVSDTKYLSGSFYQSVILDHNDASSNFVQSSNSNQCMLTLTPTYAVISSSISFYIPCIIMLGLYIKLYACAKKHVHNIRAITNIPVVTKQQVSQIPQLPDIRGTLTVETKLKSSKSVVWIFKFLPIKRPNTQTESDTTNVKLQQICEDENNHETKQMLVTQNEDISKNIPSRDTKTNDNVSTKDISFDEDTEKTNVTKKIERAPPLIYSKARSKVENLSTGMVATHKAAITLGIIMGTFLLCWVPFFCLNVIRAFCKDCIPVTVFGFFSWLGYVNSALNPIIYGIHNSEFRSAFNRMFFKHFRIGKRSRASRAAYEHRY